MDHAEALERIRDSIAAGGAICLLGAGFSTKAKDKSGRTIPSTTDLIEEIKRQVNIDPKENATLSDIADYCEDDDGRLKILRRLLIDRLTLADPSDIQRSILLKPWRSIFTTNFDDSIEQSLAAGSAQVVTPISSGTNRVYGKVPVYYMHGRARDLLENDTSPRLVISERNYIHLHENNREIYARLQNELFAANLIVIVGYSIRDLDVARVLLGAGAAFHAKTVIVCSEDETDLSVSRLSKFGTVLPIGVDGLADAVRDLPSETIPQTDALQFVQELEAPVASPEIEIDDFVRLILTGNFAHSKYQNHIQQGDNVRDPYCVMREAALSVILDRKPDGVLRYVVSSDLGNGKSTYLEQLATGLVKSGYRVFRIDNRLEESYREIDAIFELRKPVAFIIDDVIRYRELAAFIGSRLNANCLLVCALRGDPGEIVYRDLVKSLGGAVRQIDLNKLTDSEIDQWDRALERWGLWEERISLPREKRLAFLKVDCASENRSLVLSLFKSSHISMKIDQIVNFFLRSGRHEKAFAALLISSLCQRHVNWSSIVAWLDIDEPKLRNDIAKSDIASLFSHGRDWNLFTSSQLSEYILRNKYVSADKDTLTDVYTKIIFATADNAADDRLGLIYRENLKELMKFRFLTRLFGDNDDSVRLISIVYRILSQAPRIRENPQFWLQYAMSRMEVNDLANAETYLNTALGLAKERGHSYSPYQIIDQRARLLFRKNSQNEGEFSPSDIRMATNDLNSLLNDPNGEIIYLYRSVPLIRDFIDLHIDHLSSQVRDTLSKLLTDIQDAGRSFQRLPRSQKGETGKLQKAMSEALLTLQFG